jgi:hypothetical protein
MVRLEETEIRTDVRLENLKEIDHLKDLVVNWRMILKWMFKKYEWWAWIGLIWQHRDMARCSKECTESSGTVRYGKFIHSLKNCQLPMEDSIPRTW